MFLNSAIQSRTKGRRSAILAGKMAAVLSVPVILYAFGTSPPLGNTGAPGQGTCSSCHGTLTSGSGVTVALPSTTYTPGGAAVSLTVNIPSTGGFELAVLTQSGNSQAGTLAAGPAPAGAAFPQDAMSTQGSIQYVYSTVETTAWSVSWTPPATNVGNVVVYVTGGNHATNYANSYVMTPAGSPPPTPTLAASPTSLTFTVNGATPPTQAVQVTSSGSPIAFTTSVSTTSGGNWLTAIPSGGSTPLPVTVGIAAAGLTSGTYTGSVSITTSSAGISPVSVPVTLNVTTPIPPSVPTLSLGSSGLNFTATVGGTATPQNVEVTTSDGSAVTFNASASVTTPSGGTWLSASPTTGTTPSPEAISVNLNGLAAGTYSGTVTLTSSAVSNSPVSLPVTLTVTTQTPPVTGAPQFSLVVVDRQLGGSDWMLLDGTGSVSSSGQVTGSGLFTRFRSRSGGTGGSTSTIVSNGTWTATSVTSFTPVSGSSSGGVLVLQVQISPHGATSTTGSMTISSTGTNSGVTLSMNGGATFDSAGIGTVSINGASSSGGSGGGGTPGDDFVKRR